MSRSKRIEIAFCSHNTHTTSQPAKTGARAHSNDLDHRDVLFSKGAVLREKTDYSNWRLPTASTKSNQYEKTFVSMDAFAYLLRFLVCHIWPLPLVIYVTILPTATLMGYYR